MISALATTQNGSKAANLRLKIAEQATIRGNRVGSPLDCAKSRAAMVERRGWVGEGFDSEVGSQLRSPAVG